MIRPSSLRIRRFKASSRSRYIPGSGPIIALTILATALDNLRPFLPGRRWMLALGFGLIHGLGVAGGLGPMLLPPLTLAVALLAFNLGLEVVQIAIVLLLAPIGRATRSMPAVAGRVGAGLSVAAAIVAIVWFGQRFELPLRGLL